MASQYDDLEDELMDLDDNLSRYLPQKRDTTISQKELLIKKQLYLYSHPATVVNRAVTGKSKDGIVYHRGIVHALHSLMLENKDLRADRLHIHEIWKLLIKDVPKIEPQVPAQMLDHKLQCDYGTSSKNTNGLLKEHFSLLFRTCPSSIARLKTIYHSLGNVLMQFAQTFHVLYTSHIEDDSYWHFAVADLRCFMDIMDRIILFKYPFIKETHLVHECLEESVFKLCQPTLHSLVLSKCRKRDTELQNMLASSCTTITMETFEISRDLQCDFRECIEYVQENFPTASFPSLKIHVISRACELADEIISSKSPERKASTDEMIPIFAFILSKAESMHSHLATYGVLMSDFMPDSLKSGEEGFVVTLYHSAVQEMLSVLTTST